MEGKRDAERTGSGPHESALGPSRRTLAVASDVAAAPTDMPAGTAEKLGPPAPAAQRLNVAVGFSFAERSHAQTGKAPSKFQATPYASVRHWLRAGEATGGVSGEATTKAMKAAPAACVGQTATTREGGRVPYNPTLYGAESPKESRGAWHDERPVAQTPAVEASRPLADRGCSMPSQT